MTFDDWGLDFGACAPGYEGANLRRPVVRLPIERARIRGLFSTGTLAPGKPVLIRLRRIEAANHDGASAKALWMVLSIYRCDPDSDRPGDPLVYPVLKGELHGLLASRVLSSSTRDSVGTREGLSAPFEALQIDIEGPPAYPAPRKTGRAERANGESAAAPAR